MDWRSKYFPTLSRIDPVKMIASPVLFLLILATLVGVKDASNIDPNRCNGCSDIMLERQDEYACTGQVGPTGTFVGERLESCRKKIKQGSARR